MSRVAIQHWLYDEARKRSMLALLSCQDTPFLPLPDEDSSLSGGFSSSHHRKMCLSSKVHPASRADQP